MAELRISMLGEEARVSREEVFMASSCDVGVWMPAGCGGGRETVVSVLTVRRP